MPWCKTCMITSVPLQLYVKVNLIPVLHVHVYIIMIITSFIRRSTQFFEVLLLLIISANSCIRSDMQTSLHLSMAWYLGTENLKSWPIFWRKQLYWDYCTSRLYRPRPRLESSRLLFLQNVKAFVKSVRRLWKSYMGTRYLNMIQNVNC